MVRANQTIPEIDRLNQRAWAIFRQNGQHAESLCRQALAQSEAQSPHYVRGKLESLRTLAHIYNGRGAYETGGQFARQALALLPEESLHEVPAFLSRAWMLAANAQIMVKTYTQDIHEALADAYHLLSLAQALADDFLSAVYLNAIGAIYQNLNEADEALQPLKQSVALLEKGSAPFWHALALYNLGSAYENLGEYEAALDYSALALALSRRENLMQIEATTLYQIGEICMRQGQLTTADEHLRQAVTKASELGRKEIVVVSLLGLGELALAQEQPEQALSWLEQGVALAGDIGFTSPLHDFYRLLAMAHKRQGNYRQALDYYEQFHERHSTIFNDEKSRQLAQMRANYEAKAHKQQSEIYRLSNVILADKNKKLEALAHEKDELLAIVAHDLKTPLTSIMLAAEGMQMALATDRALPELIDRYGARILASSARMLSIVKRLLLVNELESGKVQPEMAQVELQPLLADLIAEISPQAQSKGIGVELVAQRPLLVIESDENWLHEVLQNLLSNAVKYSPHNSTVRVGLEGTGHAVLISVADEGPGLTPDDKRRLFQKFTRLSAMPTAGESSTGMGLYIAQRMVTALNGRLWAESEGKNRGSTFCVQLPIAGED